MAGLCGLGFVTDFLDSLGVGSFATTTTALKLGKVVDDDEIPGTLNVGHAIPSALESILFLTALNVDWLTLGAMVGAGVLGAWFGTGIVVKWPKRTVQRAMAVALLVTAGFIVLRQLHSLEVTGGTLGLDGWKLLVAVAAMGHLGVARPQYDGHQAGASSSRISTRSTPRPRLLRLSLIGPISAVDFTCVPPQGTREKPSMAQ